MSNKKDEFIKELAGSYSLMFKNSDEKQAHAFINKMLNNVPELNFSGDCQPDVNIEFKA